MLQGRHSLPIIVAVCVVFTVSIADASNWPRFRGPNGTGIANDKEIPVEFSGKNMLWQVPLPGLGNSSPMVWNDRLFVQCASKDGKERMLLCLDVKDGSTKWVQKMPAAGARIHKKNTLASSSPGVDADHVYVVFWDGNKIFLNAYTHNGHPAWTRDLGTFSSEHGAGASPIPIGDKVYFANDQDGKSLLMALDAKSGKTVWAKERPAYRACYSSPFVRELPNGKGTELLVVSTMGITGYDPATGEQRWNWQWKFKSKQPLRTTASPVFDHGMLFACSGDGGGDRHMVAVKLGDTPTLVWENRKEFPYVPTMLSHGQHLYFVNDKGFAGCYEAETGKKVWFERLEGDFTASPVLIDGKIYAANEQGDVFVIAAAPTFQLLAKNALGELIRATPAVADQRLFIRGQQQLFCIGKAP
jgi:outer membrane protein assembly factor BamB